jgi:hypothetical protein
MNLIISPTTASLMTNIVSSLFLLKIVGEPQIRFHPAKHVDLWLLGKCHPVIDTNSTERSWDTVLDKKLIRTWNFL